MLVWSGSRSASWAKQNMSALSRIDAFAVLVDSRGHHYPAVLRVIDVRKNDLGGARRAVLFRCIVIVRSHGNSTSRTALPDPKRATHCHGIEVPSP